MNQKKAFIFCLACLLFPIAGHYIFDKPIALWLGDRFSDSVFWQSATRLGDFVPCYLMLVAINLAYFLSGRVLKPGIKPAMALMALYSFLSCILIVQFLKTTFVRYRPGLLHEGFYGFSPGATMAENMDSFPSLHTAMIASLCFPFMLRYPKTVLPLSVVVGLVAASRVALNAHFLGDVFFSIGVVLAVNLALYLLMKKDL